VIVTGLVATTTTAIWADERAACREAWADHICTLYPGAYPEGQCRQSVLSRCIAHCDTGCWVGYAWNRHGNYFEWFWQAYNSHSECLGAAKSAMEGSGSYREPFGCGYTSTSFWRALLMNKLWGPNELVCIAKVPNELAYIPTFKIPSAKEENEGTHCVYNLPYKATVLARRAEELAKQNAEDAALGCRESEYQKAIRQHGNPIPAGPRDCTHPANAQHAGEKVAVSVSAMH
jgi:hypothetical protein